MNLATNVSETKDNFQKAFEPCVIALPEFGIKHEKSETGLDFVAGEESLYGVFVDFVDNKAMKAHQEALQTLALRNWEPNLSTKVYVSYFSVR